MTQSFDPEPIVSRWELRSVATMLIATHGAEAEDVAQKNLRRAVADHLEGQQIVWNGIITQLRELRNVSGDKSAGSKP